MSRMRSRAWQLVQRRSCQDGENRKHCEKSYAACHEAAHRTHYLGRCGFVIAVASQIRILTYSIQGSAMLPAFVGRKWSGEAPPGRGEEHENK